MRKPNPTPCRRRGAAVIEMAAVLIAFLMLLFGVLEFARFIFVRQVVDNAAREGARYAVVNTQRSDLTAKTQAVVTDRLAKVAAPTMTLFTGDVTGKKIGEANEAKFGEYIVVQLDCDYVPLLPKIVFMGTKIPIRAKAIMNSEAN